MEKDIVTYFESAIKTEIYHDNGILHEERWTDKEGIVHRKDGPSVIYNRLSNPYEFWYINGNNITEEVNEWLGKHNIPDWREWTKKEKSLFKLKFVK